MGRVSPGVLSFPVLCLSQDSSITVAAEAEELRSCNALALWARGYYRDLVVFDSTGLRFRVVQADSEREYSALGRFFARLINRKLRVKLLLESDGRVRLEEVKREVSEWLDRAPDFWEESDELDHWRKRISKCHRMEELMALFR